MKKLAKKRQFSALLLTSLMLASLSNPIIASADITVDATPQVQAEVVNHVEAPYYSVDSDSSSSSDSSTDNGLVNNYQIRDITPTRALLPQNQSLLEDNSENTKGSAQPSVINITANQLPKSSGISVVSAPIASIVNKVSSNEEKKSSANNNSFGLFASSINSPEAIVAASRVQDTIKKIRSAAAANDTTNSGQSNYWKLSGIASGLVIIAMVGIAASFGLQIFKKIIFKK